MVSKNQNKCVLKNEPIWRSRGYIPHFDVVEQLQMITYRLEDSLPREILIQIEDELKQVDRSQKPIERIRKIEEYLDRGAGSCILQAESIAQMVEENLLHFDRSKYELHAWVIMPNHVHILLTQRQDISLSEIVHSWKSYTAKKANAILGRQSTIWQREYFDRQIRDERHFRASVNYIHNNPVKAGLCKAPEDWKFSSIHRWLAYI